MLKPGLCKGNELGIGEDINDPLEILDLLDSLQELPGIGSTHSSLQGGRCSPWRGRSVMMSVRKYFRSSEK